MNEQPPATELDCVRAVQNARDASDASHKRLKVARDDATQMDCNYQAALRELVAWPRRHYESKQAMCPLPLEIIQKITAYPFAGARVFNPCATPAGALFLGRNDKESKGSGMNVLLIAPAMLARLHILYMLDAAIFRPHLKTLNVWLAAAGYRHEKQEYSDGRLNDDTVASIRALTAQMGGTKHFHNRHLRVTLQGPTSLLKIAPRPSVAAAFVTSAVGTSTRPSAFGIATIATMRSARPAWKITTTTTTAALVRTRRELTGAPPSSRRPLLRQINSWPARRPATTSLAIRQGSPNSR